MHGLRNAFGSALAFYLVAAVASWLRGPRYIHEEDPPPNT